MSDLGTKALLDDDLDAKVTSNAPAKENTGLRVQAFLHNLIDTLYALIGRDIAPTATFSTNTNTAQDPGQDTVRFNSGTIGSVTEIALSDVVGGVDKGDLNSRFSGIIQFRPVGTTETIEFQITETPVHTTWTRYTVTYLKGTLPANGTVMAVRFLPSNTINAAVTTALAGKADIASLPLRYKFTGDGGAATGDIGVNTFPMAVTVTNTGAGQYRFVAASGTPWTLTGKTTVGITVMDASQYLAAKVTTLSTTRVDIEIFDTVSQVGWDPSAYQITIETEP